MHFTHVPDIWMSGDPKIRRQINYWAVTAAFYTLCLAVLWFEALRGYTSVKLVTWATIGVASGVCIFYVLIRASSILKLSASQLANYQGIFAIFWIVVAYILGGPIRGVMLALLLLVLVFCAFALQRAAVHRLGALAVVLLGISMRWLAHTDPVNFQPWMEAVHFVLTSTMLCVVAYLAGQLKDLRMRLKEQKNELADAVEHIRKLATRDELTALANRRSMIELLEHEERRARSMGLPDCLAMLDIDWFKHVNDTFGHEAGDEVLRAFAQQSLVTFRASDRVGRWGGEEFLVFLPDTRQDDARAVLERFKNDVAALSFPGYTPSLRVSFSAGLVKLLPGEPAKEALKRADHALYEAKNQGRNRIVCA